MPASVTLEELIALNQEIVSLSRAGVPLEAGLREIALDQPARLAELSVTLSEHMQRGQSLAEAVESEGNRMPRVYGKVIEAGIRAGKLPAALEALTAFASKILDLRRNIGFALLYPTIVFALAYGLFLVFILEFARRVHETYDLIGLPLPGAVRILGRMGETAGQWAWIPPLVLGALILLWMRSGGARGLRIIGGTGLLRWIPGLSKITSNLQASNFADLLALMIDHGVPLPEATVLSAESVGDSRFVASAREIADTVARGDSLTQSANAHHAIPSYLCWLMAAKERQGDLAAGLRAAAAMYRRRADDQAAYLRLLFPLASAVVIGGGVTLIYALTMFLPFIQTLGDMAREVRPH
ncbi:MAG: type II secretion system F family protein [Planctomycetaceae bacterium]